MENARIFLTDYASYNNGTQFEFGHWVDLNDFDSAEELMEYIRDHFKEADEDSPLDDFGSKREEIMITDYEGFPEQLYSECMDFETFYKVKNYMEENYIDSLENEGDNLLNLWNEYCVENSCGDDQVFNFDSDTISMLFGDNVMEAMRAIAYGDVNFSHDYIYFNGYGNLETTDDPSTKIDETLIIEWIIETQI